MQMAMQDFWRKYHDEGVAAIPDDAAELSPLTWAELEELHPERMPAGYTGIDPLSSSLLIRVSPFFKEKCLQEEDDEEEEWNWSFAVEEPVTKRKFGAEIDFQELLLAVGATDYFGDEAAGILTCGCGVPGCARILSQSCHVSLRMVHWTVREPGRWSDCFFERNAYERGLVEMLHDMATSGKKYTMPYLCECEYRDWNQFVAEAHAAVARWPHLFDLWKEYASGQQNG